MFEGRVIDRYVGGDIAEAEARTTWLCHVSI